MSERKRRLTWEERATWGECPACGAEDGKKCDPNVGLWPGQHLNQPQFGAHFGRIQNAPREIREVPA